MSDSADNFSVEGMECALSGGWLTPVWSLVRWLHANSCSEYASRLERETRSVSIDSPSGVEQAGLVAVREELAVLLNSRPEHLTPQQYEQLSGLRRRATEAVQHRLSELADNADARVAATTSVAALLEQWDAGGHPSAATPPVAEASANHIRQGELVWEVRYGAECQTFPVKDFGALPTLALILARPRYQHHFKNLVDPETARLLAATRGKDDQLDAEALARLEHRYHELQRDIAEEEDAAEKERLRAELAPIAAEIRAAVRPDGRRRKLGHSEEDQAWDALTKGLRRLRDRLHEAKMPELAAHLKAAISISRPHITYLPPDGTPPWVIET